MNIKHLIVTYVDKVVLAAMVVVFAGAAYNAFFRGSPEREQLWEEIPRDLTTLERNLVESEPEPVPEYRDAEVLEERYAHLPVVQPYRRFVLFRPAPLQWGTFHFVKDRPTEIELPEVQLVRVLSYDRTHLEVSSPRLIDEDNPAAGSKLEIKPLEPTGSRGVDVLVRDLEGVQYVARAIVYRERPRIRPRPPREVEVAVHRGTPLLKMRWDNPSPLPSDVAETKGFWVYRKTAGRPDDTFELLNERELAVPDPRRRRRIEEELRIGEYAPRHDLRVSDDYYDDDILDAEPVRERRPAARREERLRDRETERREAGLAYFADFDAEPGDTYVYRVVAVSAEVDGERRQSDPWDSDSIEVPSDVQFWLSNLLGGSARIRVLKRDYDRDGWHDATFLVAPGMPIGRERTLSVTNPYTRERERIPVDFSTGATLVGVFPGTQAYEPSHGWVREEVPGAAPSVQQRWELQETTADYAVVLTRRGELVRLYRGSPPSEMTRSRREAPASRQRRDRRDLDDPDLYDY